MSNTNKPINKKYFQASWKGLFFILKERKTHGKFPFMLSIFLSFSISITIAFVFPNRTFDILSQTSELAFSFFPGLLGFSLGGYAIAVGFSNTELLKFSAKRDGANIYQLLNAIFASAIIIQVFTTMISFIVTWTIRINLSKDLPASSKIVAISVNSSVLFFLLLGIIYSLVISIYVVLNLWSIAQVNNSYYSVEKFIEENTEENKNHLDPNE